MLRTKRNKVEAEDLPGEMIGEILSLLPDACQVVTASTTCKTWRSAMQHLKSLKFSSRVLLRLLTRGLQSTTITQTIHRTSGLVSLSINSAETEFLAVQVRDWLLHTRDSLRELNLHHNIVPSLNVVEDFRGNKLEVLKLLHVSLVVVELGNEALFPCLKTLRLERVEISALDLCNLLALCPKIEDLSLNNMKLGPNPTLQWSTTTLKSLDIATFDVDKFVLEAGGNMTKLEQVDVKLSEIEGFYDMISESSNLARLQIWRVLTDGYYTEFTDMDNISGSSPLQNLVELEIGIASCENFSDKVGRFMEFCPNLKKVVFCLVTGWMDGKFFAYNLPEYSSYIYQLSRKFVHVELEFGDDKY